MGRVGGTPMAAVKAPSGRRIWKAVRDELMLNLYPLPYSTLAPAVYHVYLHPEDFESIEPVAPRIVGQIQRALADEVQKLNRGLERSNRRVLTRLLDRETLPPLETPASGWEIHITADRNGDLERGQLGIVSTLAMPAPVEYGGTPTTRIVKSVVGHGRRTATTTDVQEPAVPSKATSAPLPRPADNGERARLKYEDEQGPHVFVMRKESLSVGRGGSSAWVDVQIVGSSKVSREHFRLRCDPAGRFYIQDVSLWGTSVDGTPIPPAVKTADGVTGPGDEFPLPPKASIRIADVVVIEFESIAS
ncbi:MAG TPA: FHA domain-containing protein [Vicinamibacterales bacterium]|nr:FHA domain-containing protein [Vicinamibacterales bacterium]